MSVTQTLVERGKSYGSYAARSEIEQSLIDCMVAAPGWSALGAPHKSAARMFAVKLSRILNGDPNHKDSWHDIAGYAQLVEETIAEPCRHEKMLSDGRRVECAACHAELPIHVV